MGWNLPPGCTDRDIDEAAPQDEPEDDEPGEPEDPERLVADLRDALKDLVAGECCDHDVNICWCREFDLLARAAEFLGEPTERKG